MDFHVNDAQHADPVLDFHRFVLLFTHSFSERVRFVSELELDTPSCRRRSGWTGARPTCPFS